MQRSKTPGGVLDGERRQRTHRNQSQRQTEAESQHQSETKHQALQLQADQQHGESRRARQESARQTEHDKLSSRDIPIGKALLPIARVSPFVFVLILEV